MNVKETTTELNTTFDNMIIFLTTLNTGTGNISRGIQSSFIQQAKYQRGRATY